MAAVTKITTPSISTPNPPDSCRVGPLLVGEDIAAGDACYIKSDGKIWRSTGAAVAAAAEVDGFAPTAALVAQRQSLSIYREVDFNYSTGMAPGTYLYLSGTVAGGLDTAVSTGGTKPVARVIDATRVRVNRSIY